MVRPPWLYGRLPVWVVLHSRHAPVISGIVPLLAILLLVTVSAAAKVVPPIPLAVEARENGCPPGQTFCLVVTHGSLAALRGGDLFYVRFLNSGTVPHELAVTDFSQRHASHQATSKNPNIRGVENATAGHGGEFHVHVAPEFSGLYFWCDMPGHEEQGMWLEAPIVATNVPPNETPIPLAASLLPLAAAVVVAARRRPLP